MFKGVCVWFFFFLGGRVKEYAKLHHANVFVVPLVTTRAQIPPDANPV